MELMDCHVHVDDIRVYSEVVAKKLKKNVGDIVHPKTSPERYARHIKENNIEVLFAIYENRQSIIDLKRAVVKCKVEGFYFVRKIDSIDWRLFSNLHRDGILQGIKIHPTLDDFKLTEKNLELILMAARKYKIPILYHSDDRNKFMHLTAPALQEELIKENSDICFIIGHGGVYANPRLCGEGVAAIGYWNGKNAPYSRIELVNSALQLALQYDNVYYDLSIASNKTKAALIVNFIRKNPGVVKKILVGTDFPIKFSKTTTQIKALIRAGLDDKFVKQIIENRL